MMLSDKMMLLLVLCFLSGGGLALEVHQPSDLITTSGGRVQIFCSHAEKTYRVMLWYQRSPGDTALKLIGYLYFKDVKLEEGFREDFNMSGDLGGSTEKNGSLIIESVRKELSAVYYCAAREARREKSPLSITKTISAVFLSMVLGKI
ncbi:Immunoglobulin lambda variable 3-25 [Xyrichtys novacula]|nr:Immunoglobulin lambda variable 3-25 [Xyrichtys novacula]